MAKLCVLAVLLVLYINSKVEALYRLEDEELMLSNVSDLEEIKMPDACEGQTFCFEKGDNYPDEKIAKLVSDVNEMLLNLERPSIGDRKKRALSGFHEEPLCASNTTESPMYYIIDENDRVRVVVQAPNKFQQHNSLMWCLNEGPITRESSYFIPGIFRQFIIECVTSKVDLELFVLSDEVGPETNEPKMEIAKIKGGVPACCKCQYSTLSTSFL